MKSKLWLFGLGLVAVVFVVEYDVAQRSFKNGLTYSQTKKNKTVSATSSRQVFDQTAAVTQPVDSKPVDVAEKNLDQAVDQTFEKKFIKESRQISKLQMDPDQVEKRLDQLAHQMSDQDIQNLSKVMSDQNKDGDERAMAVEILSRRQTAESLKALHDFVVAGHHTEGATPWNRLNEFESVLKAQAIEGVASYPEKKEALKTLNSLASQVSESFLRDRISRSEAGLKGRAAGVEKSDNDALRKLIE